MRPLPLSTRKRAAIEQWIQWTRRLGSRPRSCRHAVGSRCRSWSKAQVRCPHQSAWS